MTRQEILSELERLQPWFHRIDLGDGIFTKSESVMGEPVDHPAGPWQTIRKCIPEDLRGKSLLDVGCNAGFYAFEASRRGAKRVLGVDGQRQHIRQALFVRKALGLEVEFRRKNVYELTRRSIGQFDITLALGLIYHLKHPILALENLYEVTRDLLVIETAILPPGQTPPSFSHPLGERTLRLHSLAYVENPADAKEQVFNWFLPGVEALVSMVRNAGFSEVEVIEVKAERAVLACRKSSDRQMGADVLRHFVALLSLDEGPRVCQASEQVTFRIRTENIGVSSWTARGETISGTGGITLGAHLLAADEEELVWDFGRAELTHDVEPGKTVTLEIQLRAPRVPGTYIIEFDMVVEHVSWFEDFGSGTLRHEIVVS